MNDNSPLAECLAVSRSFGRSAAVDGVDLRLGRGEVVGLLGANGAGKTTLIRVLLGLLPPTAGQVRLFGGPPSRPARRRVGYVPQTLGLYDDLTPAENLAFSASVFGCGTQAELPGSLRGYRRVLVGDLPLGVQRQVAFTEALAHRPDLLILDEPTVGLDPEHRELIWSILGAERRERGTTVLFSTHYLAEAEPADQVVLLSRGRAVADGTPAALRAAVGAEVAEIEGPGAERLARAIRGLGATATVLQTDRGFRVGNDALVLWVRGDHVRNLRLERRQW